MDVQHLNPDGLHKSPAFSQAIILPPGARTMIIGGQNGVDDTGALVSADFGEQAARALDNMIVILQAAGTGLEALVKMTIFMKDGESVEAGYGAWMQRWGMRPNPPAISVINVPGFARPGVLIEIEGLAVLK